MKTKILLLLSMVLFFASCRKEELLTDRIDFTNEDIADIIKMNFLEEYGGILMEKDYIYNLSRNHDFSEAVTENISADFESADSTFYMTMKGEYKNKYDKFVTTNFNRFISYNNNGSSGRSYLGKFEIGFSHSILLIKISGNVSDNRFVFSVNSTREITFLKGLKSTQNFEGEITFLTGPCTFDYKQSILTPFEEYRVRLDIFNRKISNDITSLRGKIIREQSNWVFISEDGDRIPL